MEGRFTVRASVRNPRDHNDTPHGSLGRPNRSDSFIVECLLCGQRHHAARVCCLGDGEHKNGVERPAANGRYRGIAKVTRLATGVSGDSLREFGSPARANAQARKIQRELVRPRLAPSIGSFVREVHAATGSHRRHRVIAVGKATITLIDTAGRKKRMGRHLFWHRFQRID